MHIFCDNTTYIPWNDFTPVLEHYWMVYHISSNSFYLEIVPTQIIWTKNPVPTTPSACAIIIVSVDQHSTWIVWVVSQHAVKLYTCTCIYMITQLHSIQLKLHVALSIIKCTCSSMLGLNPIIAQSRVYNRGREEGIELGIMPVQDIFGKHMCQEFNYWPIRALDSVVSEVLSAS